MLEVLQADQGVVDLVFTPVLRIEQDLPAELQRARGLRILIVLGGHSPTEREANDARALVAGVSVARPADPWK